MELKALKARSHSHSYKCTKYIWCKIFGWVGNWVLASIWRRLFQFMTQAFIHQCKELCTFRCFDKSKKPYSFNCFKMNSTLWNTNEEALGHFILGGTSLFVHAYAIFICYAISDYQGLSIYYEITRKITTVAYLLTFLYFHNSAGCWIFIHFFCFLLDQKEAQINACKF